MIIRYLLSLLFLLIGGLSFAQSTLTSANSNPVIGEQFSYVNYGSSGFAQGDSGANITWTLFSGLSSMNPTSSEAVDPSGLIQSSSFPGANLGFLDMNLVESYYVANSDSFAFMGGFDPSTGTIVDMTEDPWVYIKYPITYGDTFTDQFLGINMPSVGSPSDRTGELISTIDGYGDLVLPSGTISGVLRMKTVASYQDTALGIEVANFSEVRYIWYAPGIHQPVVAMTRINSTLLGFPSPPILTVFGVDQSQTMSLLDPEELAEWTVFPNPAHTYSQIEFRLTEGGMVQFVLMNNMGQIIKEKAEKYFSTGTHVQTWDLPDVAAGSYFLQLRMNDRLATKHIEIR